MQGCRSRSPELVPLDPEIECSLRAIRAKIYMSRTLGSPPPAEMAEEQPKLLKEYFIPSIYTSPSCIRLPDVTTV